MWTGFLTSDATRHRSGTTGGGRRALVRAHVRAHDWGGGLVGEGCGEGASGLRLVGLRGGRIVLLSLVLLC